MRLIIISQLFLLTFTTSGQKKYMTKITANSGAVYKGLLFEVQETGITIIPNGILYDNKNKESNISKTKFLSYDDINEIKVRRRGNGFIGLLIGQMAGLFLVASSVDNLDQISQGILVYYSVVGISAIAGFSPNYKFKVQESTTSISVLKEQLPKYAWYKRPL